MRVYVSLPITGKLEGNLHRAVRMRQRLYELGFDPVIPHDIQPANHDGLCQDAHLYPAVTGSQHGGFCHLRADIAELMRCDIIVTAAGWPLSRGCRAEVQAAKSVHIPHIEWSEVDETVPEEVAREVLRSSRTQIRFTHGTVQ